MSAFFDSKVMVCGNNGIDDDIPFINLVCGAGAGRAGSVFLFLLVDYFLALFYGNRKKSLVCPSDLAGGKDQPHACCCP
jgi:hypothetical protein